MRPSQSDVVSVKSVNVNSQTGRRSVAKDQRLRIDAPVLCKFTRSDQYIRCKYFM